MTLLGESSGVEENIASCHLPYDIVVISESAHIRPGGVGVADTHAPRTIARCTRSPPAPARGAARAPRGTHPGTDRGACSTDDTTGTGGRGGRGGVAA